MTFSILGQARLDGAFCGYTAEDKYEYLIKLKEAGVSNIEMEATCFAALTHMAGFKAAIVCVTLVNRLDEDQVLKLFQSQCFLLHLYFLKNTLETETCHKLFQ